MPGFLRSVLGRIRPPPGEKRRAMELAGRIISKIHREAVLVGSVARDTSLAGNGDLDIFVFFPESEPRELLEKEGLEIGKKALAGHKPVTHYAEHPYTKAKVGEFIVEIVPCFKVSGKPKSAVDRSPLHNAFILASLKGSQKDEVRLLKQFLKASGAYGAEQRIKGFSGYLCELLVMNYGSFDRAIKAASQWSGRMIIDMKRARANYSQFGQQLVFMDPVDSDRNVAANVSEENFWKLVLKARAYLKKPAKEFFFPKEKKINVKKALAGRNLLVVSLPYPKVIEEIAWSQLEKASAMLQRFLQANDFAVKNKFHWADDKSAALILAEMDSLSLSSYRKHYGPLVRDAVNAEKFMQRNPVHFLEGNRLWAWKKREFTDAAGAARAFLKTQLPSHLEAKKAKVLYGSALLNDKKTLPGLEAYFKGV